MSRPAGDVVLVAEADEERNTADVGMSWLVRERPDLRCDFALNEGGGMLLELADGRRVVIVSVGEKQVTSLRLRLHGRAGHASVPSRGDNPLRHAATAVAAPARPPTRRRGSCRRLERALDAPRRARRPRRRRSPGPPPSTRSLADAAAGDDADDGHPDRARRPSSRANVIPPFADVICDCRALPGDTEERDPRAGRRAALGNDLRYELELLEPLEGGTESPIDTPLYRICEDYVAERLAGGDAAAARSPPASPTRTGCAASYGTVAYGFAPVFATDPPAYMDAAHGADEALAIDDLVEMAEFHLYAIRELARA